MTIQLYSFPLIVIAALQGGVAQSQEAGSVRQGAWNELVVSELTVGGECVVIEPEESLGRAAIVIGNGAYHPAIGWLESPYNDAIGIAALSLNLGFDVFLATDADRSAIEACIEKLTARASVESLETSMLFYSGHGVQVSDENYIVPVGGDPLSLEPQNLVSLNKLVDVLRSVSANTLVFLDACRTLPPLEGRSQGLSMSTTETFVPNDSSGQGEGTKNEFLITYATQPGNVASAGSERFSPFTAALIEELGKPNTSIQEALTNVTLKVGQRTAWQQQPFTRTTLSKMMMLRSENDPAQAIQIAKARAIDAMNLLNQGKRDEALELLLKSVPVDLEDWSAGDLETIDGVLKTILFTRTISFSGMESLDGFSGVGSLAFSQLSADGSRAILLFSNEEDSLVALLDPLSGQVIRSWREVYTDGNFDFSPDDSQFAWFSSDGVLSIASSLDGSVLHQVRVRETRDLIDGGSGQPFQSSFYGKVDFSPDGKILMLQSSEYETGDFFFMLVDAASGSIIRDSSKDGSLGVLNSNQQMPGFGKVTLSNSVETILPSRFWQKEDVHLKFRDDDVVCVFFNNPTSLDFDQLETQGSTVFGGFWNWRLSEISIDMALEGQQLGYESDEVCNKEGSRLVATYSVGEYGENTGLSETWFVDGAGVPIALGSFQPLGSSSDGSRALAMSYETGEFTVIDLLTGVMLFDLSKLGLGESVMGDEMPSGAGFLKLGLLNGFKDQRLFYPPTSLSETINLALTSLPMEQREQIVSARVAISGN